MDLLEFLFRWVEEKVNKDKKLLLSAKTQKGINIPPEAL